MMSVKPLVLCSGTVWICSRHEHTWTHSQLCHAEHREWNISKDLLLGAGSMVTRHAEKNLHYPWTNHKMTSDAYQNLPPGTNKATISLYCHLTKTTATATSAVWMVECWEGVENEATEFPQVSPPGRETRGPDGESTASLNDLLE